jgi:uncharacterized protein (DUF2062 family)
VTDSAAPQGAARAGGFLRTRIAAPVVEQLRQGLSPDRIALTIAIGLCIAIIPVVGVTTIMSFLAAWLLRLNQPIIQAINWSSYALQLLMILPFVRLGEWMFRTPRLGLSAEGFVAMAKADPFGTIVAVWPTLWHAVAAWAITVPLLGAVVYYSLRPALRSLARRIVAARRPRVNDVA